MEQDMLMLVGTKTSSTRSKDQKFDSKEEAKEAAKRARVEVSTNKKARSISRGSGFDIKGSDSDSDCKGLN